MSAYIVDPRTIDYLVQWGARHRSVVRDGERVRLDDIPQNELGQILMTENVRSVRTRYPQDSADTLPGPVNQKRVWRYHFQPVPHQMLKPAWVIKACDCLDYQSCETDDWRETLAYQIVQAIRESAISALTDDAPWGITDDDLSPKPVAK